MEMGTRKARKHTHTPEGQSNSSLRLTKWRETFHRMYKKHLCITVGLEVT